VIHIYLRKLSCGHYEITYRRVSHVSDVMNRPAVVLSSITSFVTAMKEVRKLAKSYKQKGKGVDLRINNCGKKHDGKYTFGDGCKMWRD
jgi:hypothetical protein